MEQSSLELLCNKYYNNNNNVPDFKLHLDVGYCNAKD